MTADNFFMTIGIINLFHDCLFLKLFGARLIKRVFNEALVRAGLEYDLAVLGPNLTADLQLLMADEKKIIFEVSQSTNGMLVFKIFESFVTYQA